MRHPLRKGASGFPGNPGKSLASVFGLSVHVHKDQCKKTGFQMKFCTNWEPKQRPVAGAEPLQSTSTRAIPGGNIGFGTGAESRQGRAR